MIEINIILTKSILFFKISPANKQKHKYVNIDVLSPDIKIVNETIHRSINIDIIFIIFF